MKRRSFLSAAAAAVPALQSVAQSAPAAASLFDGNTLSGWTVRDGPESAFYVEDGAIVVSEAGNFPTWLRSARTYENFDLEAEFFIRGWIDSGIYIHAPEHGRNTWEGIQVKIFHQRDETPKPNSMGSLFPLIAPKRVNVRNRGEWNSIRIRMDWPQLDVWTNGEQVQSVNLESLPEFRYRLRSGYLGLASLSYPIRFRNLRIRELPGKERWDPLYTQASDLDKWSATGKPNFHALGGVLRGDGLGYLVTREQYRDFELRAYVRGMAAHNGGVLFRTEGKGSDGRHYEIQLHDVEEAHYPTGSLYHYQRSIYPKIAAEQWFPFHLIVQGKRCIVRVNGDTVVDYDQLDNLDEGHIELQAHRSGYWTEYKDIRIKRL
jgi:hypothetical protein